MLSRWFIAAALAAIVPMQNVSAGIHVANVSLDGAQQVPANGSAGTGTATVTLDDVTGSITVTGTYTGLTGNQTVVHIHGPAAAGANAGVVVGLTGTGGMAGNVSGGGTLNSTQVADALAGLNYINIHSSSFPGGEIRGQVEYAAAPAVPAYGPLGFGILALGLVGCGAFVVSRRKHAAAL